MLFYEPRAGLEQREVKDRELRGEGKLWYAML